MISIRRQIQDADHFASHFEALRNARLALTAARKSLEQSRRD